MRAISLLILCSALVWLSACSREIPKTTQSLVKVGDAEVTVHQLNNELSHLGQDSDSKQQQVLDMLIDRRLLQSEAVRNKLDRDPEVVQAIERAKSQILAQAYLKTRTLKVAPPTKVEVEEYFAKRPELFAHRKEFETREIVVLGRVPREALQTATNTFKSIESVEAWLMQRGAEYLHKRGKLSAMDLPPEMLTRLSSAQKGDLFFVQTSSSTVVGQLVDVKESPVVLSDVEKQIEQFLMNKKRQDAVNDEIKRLRGAVTIQYLNKALMPAHLNEQKSEPTTSSNSTLESQVARGVAGLK